MRLAIIEDDRMLRENLRLLLSGEAGIEVVGAFGSAEEALDGLGRCAPELLLVSAGFDAHSRDPLAGMRVTDEGFREMTRILLRLAKGSAGSRLVSLLEGGYDRQALPLSVAAHIETLMES